MVGRLARANLVVVVPAIVGRAPSPLSAAGLVPPGVLGTVDPEPPGDCTEDVFAARRAGVPVAGATSEKNVAVTVELSAAAGS